MNFEVYFRSLAHKPRLNRFPTSPTSDWCLAKWCHGLLFNGSNVRYSDSWLYKKGLNISDHISLIEQFAKFGKL